MASFGEVATGSAIQAVTRTGSHDFKVFGYSLTKGIGIGKHINSDVFNVDGDDWTIRYYPDGHSFEHKEFISFFPEHKGAASTVKTSFSFRNVDPPFDTSIEPYSIETTFKSITAPMLLSSGYYVVSRNGFEASECIKDDAFTVRCNVTVVKGMEVRAINSLEDDVVPPPALHKNFLSMLTSGKGADVTFLVEGEEFRAHRCVLAARSAVFNAMFFGCMKEKETDTILVNDIEAPTFKSMLRFIYTDSFYFLGKKQERSPMISHLLVAADMYALERLRFKCELILGEQLSASNVATTLILAERHNCNQLKARCLKFMSLPDVFMEVALAPDFEDLMKMVPSVLKDIRALKLNGYHS